MSTRHVRAVDRPGATAHRYLGDGVYVVFDGFGVWLTVEHGLSATDAIYLGAGGLSRIGAIRRAGGAASMMTGLAAALALANVLAWGLLAWLVAS